jgi:hypothetical protein
MPLTATPTYDRKLIQERAPLPAWRIRHLTALGWTLEMIETPSSRQWAYTFTRRPSEAVEAAR